MTLFVKYLAQFIGPKGADTTKLLIVDGHTPPAETEPYLNYFVRQNYGAHSCSAVSGFPWEKCIYTENIGDYWTTGGGLRTRQPSSRPRGTRADSVPSWCSATTIHRLGEPTRRCLTAICVVASSCRIPRSSNNLNESRL